MNIEKKREEFEAAYMASMDTDLPPSVWLERRANGSYASVSTKAAWWAWQASRAAIEIELPKHCDKDGHGVAVYSDEGPFFHCHDTIEAIHAAGVKIR